MGLPTVKFQSNIYVVDMPRCFLALHTNKELQNGTLTKSLQNICTIRVSAATGKLDNVPYELRVTSCLVYTTISVHDCL